MAKPAKKRGAALFQKPESWEPAHDAHERATGVNFWGQA